MASNGNYANTFLKSGPDIDRADMMVTLMAWCTNEELKPQPFSGFTVLAEHIRPDARGSVRLKSPDPTAAPAIRFNFLASEADRRAAIGGLKAARKIAGTEPLRSYVAAEFNPVPIASATTICSPIAGVRGCRSSMRRGAAGWGSTMARRSIRASR